jgi:hypothetical protein
MFRHVSQSGQTLGNISEKHRPETSNVSEFGRKHFCFPGSKFCFRNNVSTVGQTWKHLRKHLESQMFPQQCFLVCPGLNFPTKFEMSKFYLYFSQLSGVIVTTYAGTDRSSFDYICYDCLEPSECLLAVVCVLGNKVAERSHERCGTP